MRASVWMARRTRIVAFMVLLLAACRPSIGPAPTPTPGETAEPVLEATVPVALATPTPEPATPTAEPTPSAVLVECTVTVRSLRLRAGPTTEAAIITALSSGQPLTAHAHNPEANWLAVQTPEGLSGWVAAEFVSCAQPIDSLPVATAAPATP